MPFIFCFGGCIEQPLKRLAGAYAGRFNLIHPTAQRLNPMGGGLSLLHRITAMTTQSKSAQNSEQARAQDQAGKLPQLPYIDPLVAVDQQHDGYCVLAWPVSPYFRTIDEAKSFQASCVIECADCLSGGFFSSDAEDAKQIEEMLLRRRGQGQ